LPDIRAARTLENGLYLVGLMLWMVHFLALYRALRATNLAAALFGRVLGVVGLAILAADALPHVATLPISALYHAPGAPPQDQAAFVAVWAATEGIGGALLGTGSSSSQQVSSCSAWPCSTLLGSADASVG
jgi:hypothetical protein